MQIISPAQIVYISVTTPPVNFRAAYEKKPWIETPST